MGAGFAFETGVERFAALGPVASAAEEDAEAEEEDPEALAVDPIEPEAGSGEDGALRFNI